MKNWKQITFVVAFLAGMTTTHLHAQPPAGSWGVGIQFGYPSGLNVKHYNPGGASFDALFAWDLNDFLFVNIHGLWEKSLSGSPDFNFYYGPGAFIGFTNRNKRKNIYYEDDIHLGISGTVGLNVYIDRFEIYLQATPRLELIERTDASIGGGVGFRFFF